MGKSNGLRLKNGGCRLASPRGAASYGRTKIRKTETVTKKQGEIAKKRGANGEKRGAFPAPLRRRADGLGTSVF